MACQRRAHRRRITVAAIGSAVIAPGGGTRLQHDGWCVRDCSRWRPFVSGLPRHDADRSAPRRAKSASMSLLVGVAVGGLAGAGTTFAVYGVPRYRRPGLDDRLGPYLRD